MTKNKQRPDISQQKTFIAIVLDESGSMGVGRDLTIEGFNKQLAIIRDGARDAGQTFVTFIKFNSNPNVLMANQPVAEVAELNRNNYRPNGGTALYDAVAQAVSILEAKDDGAADTAFLVSVFTDGEENSSREYTAAALKARIESLQNGGRWTFSLLGPRNGVASMADLLNIDRGNVAGFDFSTVVGRSSALDAIMAEKRSYMATRAHGLMSCNSLYAGVGGPLPKAGPIDPAVRAQVRTSVGNHASQATSPAGEKGGQP